MGLSSCDALLDFAWHNPLGCADVTGYVEPRHVGHVGQETVLPSERSLLCGKIQGRVLLAAGEGSGSKRHVPDWA